MDILKQTKLLHFIKSPIKKEHNQLSLKPIPLELDHIGGVCCLIRNKVLKEVGFYDEGFFMYCEDLDLSLRARQQAWQCYQVPEAKVLHYISTSISKRTRQWVYSSFIRYAKKHHFIGVAFLTLLLIIFLRIIRNTR